jgi:hypothetical protein
MKHDPIDILLGLMTLAIVLAAILYAISPRVVTNEGDNSFNYTTVNAEGDQIYNTDMVGESVTGATAPGTVTMPCDFDANEDMDCTIEVETGRKCGKC